MYTVPAAFPTDTVPPSTHLLGLGPPMLGLRDLAYRFVERGLADGDHCVLVSTDRGAARVAEAFADATPSPERLAIVDATGQEVSAGSVPHPVESVGSPGDLTGIGIAITELLERLHDDGAERYRVVFDSLSSLLVYADFERVYRFVHTLTNRVDQIDGTSLFLLNSDTDSDQIQKLESLFDGFVELAERDGETRIRLRGLDAPTDWRPVDAEPGPATVDQPPDADVGAEVAEPAARTVEVPDSLHALIAEMEAAGLTLTVCNYTGDEDTLAELTAFFERLNVAVRTAELSTTAPTDVAMLHRGNDVVATSPVAELDNALRLDALEADAEVTAMVRPAVLEEVYREEYAVDNGGKLQMVRISRLVETRALETGAGELHAGFQRLDRVADELGTQDLYESIARTDVDVHMYGEAGDVPNADWYTLHTDPVDELAASWFVVFDGAGQDARKAALVSEETGPERYSGFWTYQPPLVDAVTTYLRSTYVEP